MAKKRAANHAERDSLKRREKPQAKISPFPARAGLLLLTFTVLLGGAILYFVLGTTTITITRQPIAVTRSFPVVIEEHPDSAEAESGDARIAGAIITTEAEVADTFTPESDPQITEQPATGTVTIYNNWSQVQPLAATTRLLSESGVLFRIPARIDVPAGGSITSPIYADESGKAGEVPAGRFTIPGLWAGLQDKIYAESTAPTTGGVVEVKLLTDADLTRAREALQEKAKTTSENTLRAKDIPENLALEPSSITASLINEEHSAELGEQVENFTLTRTESITALALDTAALQELARTELSRTLESDRTLTEGTVSYAVALPEDTGTLPMHITVTATGEALLTTDTALFNPEELASLSETRIQEHFSDTPGVASVAVQFSPFWITRAPSNPAQITVLVK